MLRTLLERLGRGMTFKRRLPAEFGRTPLFVSPDAQLKYLKPGKNAFDVSLLRLAKEEVEEHSAVWDIGANIGIFTFAAASIARTGSVLAIEPDIWLAQVIKRSANLSCNKLLNVNVLPVAISNSNGAATFLIAQRGRASNALERAGGRSQMGGVRERASVPTLTLDTLLNHFPAPDLIKIDVEGAEVSILQGATQLLKNIRPKIYIEVDTQSEVGVSQILMENNYTLFDPQSPKSARSTASGGTPNLLALPHL